MPYTFNDMSFLTAAQRTAAQALADLGAQIKGPSQGEPHPVPGLTPPLTLSQTKRAAEIMRDLDALWLNARRGVVYSVNYYRQQALQALDNDNP
jgi:hypothetical protein